MNTYSIGSDSPRWWWPSATAGAVGAAAIAVILVIPTTGTSLPDRSTPQDPPVLTRDPWVSTIDPALGRQCFALPPRWNAAVEHHGHPRCGHAPATQQQRRNGVRRPGLDARP